MTRLSAYLVTSAFKKGWEVVAFPPTSIVLSRRSEPWESFRRVPKAQAFNTTSWVSLNQMPPRPKPPPDTDIQESFLKGSGPGGQKINKTNSAVQLKHIPTGIVVKCQETRSRDQNRKIARQLLATKLDDLNNGDQSRSAIVAAKKVKKRASAAKKSARKYRKLDTEKNMDVDKGTEASKVVAVEGLSTNLTKQGADRPEN